MNWEMLFRVNLYRKYQAMWSAYADYDMMYNLDSPETSYWYSLMYQMQTDIQNILRVPQVIRSQLASQLFK